MTLYVDTKKERAVGAPTPVPAPERAASAPRPALVIEQLNAYYG
jgi:hypothetical protein